MNNQWYRVEVQRSTDPKPSVVGYVQSPDPIAAMAHFELFGLCVLNPTAHPVKAEEVPYKTRAFAEATTEELRNALRTRGWKVVLQ